ncbi:hypothetical protein KFV54_13310 (plasmid) [Staphylococcus epidermidis]|uniref:hypothetical protein n=1 Tax=Staphylococcus epidermidis TaxID=1282 RepID=UPI001C57DCCE|nr:hypothetical protein [Staphylococcus epidermidis]QXU96439.1 hypothetical protein KFV54_13310 [Staphylococcus epidermidis]
MKTLYIMLIHAKRHQPLGEKTFYMAYSVMINYGNNSNRSKLKRYLEELQQLNRISIEENHVIDPVMSEIKVTYLVKTNVYSIKKKL